MTAKKKDSDRILVDVTKLDEAKQKRLDRIIHPRDTPLGLRFFEGDIEAWKKLADSADVSLTEWIETKLNEGRTDRK